MAIYFHAPASHMGPRARVIADLMRAQRALSHDPDLAALYLDGALRRLLALVARQARVAPSEMPALASLDREQPLLGMRLRLALRAPDAAARLVHCWALIESLNEDAPAPDGRQDPRKDG